MTSVQNGEWRVRTRGTQRRTPNANLSALNPPLSTPLLAVENLHVSYGAIKALHGVSLKVTKGSIVTLIGANGAGKSTTLRMINRLVSFDRGSIRVGGKDVRAVPPEELRRRIGYTIQSIGLFPHWRVEDNIATVPRLLRCPHQRVIDRVTELLQLLRLDL